MSSSSASVGSPTETMAPSVPHSRRAQSPITCAASTVPCGWFAQAHPPPTHVRHRHSVSSPPGQSSAVAQPGPASPASPASAGSVASPSRAASLVASLASTSLASDASSAEASPLDPSRASRDAPSDSPASSAPADGSSSETPVAHPATAAARAAASDQRSARWSDERRIDVGGATGGMDFSRRYGVTDVTPRVRRAVSVRADRGDDACDCADQHGYTLVTFSGASVRAAPRGFSSPGARPRRPAAPPARRPSGTPSRPRRAGPTAPSRAGRAACAAARRPP